MNGDTFSAASFGAYRNNLVATTGLGTTETNVKMVSDSGNVSAFVKVPLQSDVIGSNPPIDSNANAAILGPNFGRPGADYRGARPYFSSTSLSGRPFCLQASGYFTTSAVAAGAHQFNLYQATLANGPVIGTGTQLFSGLSSATLAAGNYNYLVILNLIWDSVSQSLGGFGEAIVGGVGPAGSSVYTSRTVITPVTVTSPTNLLFFQTVKFQSGGANSITPVELNLSQF